MKDFHEEVYGSDSAAIAFFQRNYSLFAGIGSFKFKAELELFQEMHLCYIGALYNLGKYNKCLNEALQFQPLIEDGLEEYGINFAEDERYKWLLFKQAQANYFLRDYAEAKRLLKIVLSYEPDNDAFIGLMLSTRRWERQKLFNFLTVVGAIIFTATIFLKRSMPRNLEFFLSSLGLLLMLIPQFQSFFFERNRRKR